MAEASSAPDANVLWMPATERSAQAALVTLILGQKRSLNSVSAADGVCVAAERKTGKLDFDVGRPDALEIRIEISGRSFLDIERL